MPLNFIGPERSPGKAPAPLAGRLPVAALAWSGLAALLAGLVFAVTLRQHRAEVPPPAPPLVGQDVATLAARPPAPAAPEPQWIEHKAAPAAPVASAPHARQAAEPSQEDAAAAGKARMLAALRQVPHGVITLSVEDDPAAQALADKLAGLFREAGWTVQESSVFGSGPPRRGLYAAFGVSPADEATREAFDAVGFQFAPPPEDAGVTRTPEIFVGVPIRPRARP